MFIATEMNRSLFFVSAGLLICGADAYDHNDHDVAILAERIKSVALPANITKWFAGAKTSQVAVNPFWPRGSALAAACFFSADTGDKKYLDREAYLSFLYSASFRDPIGLQDFYDWIIAFDEVLAILDVNEDLLAQWLNYHYICGKRTLSWETMLYAAADAASDFYGAAVPAMSFAPNLLAAHNTDYVRLTDRIVTIAATPDVEGMLHETLHTTVADYRELITAFASKHGMAGFADREKMISYGYLVDDSAPAIAHVIEECIVRAIAVVLAGKGEDRLRRHAELGCDSVPVIAAQFRASRPVASELGAFIKNLLAEEHI